MHNNVPLWIYRFIYITKVFWEKTVNLSLELVSALYWIILNLLNTSFYIFVFLFASHLSTCTFLYKPDFKT